jgi:S1-C subfamily serine protease
MPEPFSFQFPEGSQGNAIGYNGADQTWTIQGLSEDSPLYDAGLRQGDIITAFNGESYDPRALSQFLAGLDNNETVTVTVERTGESMDLDVPAEALNAFGQGFGFGFRGEGNAPFDMMPFGMFGGGSRLGVTFMTLDEQVAQENNVDATEGALVVEVAPDSPAADAGVQADDVITAVNNESVDAEHTLRDRLVAYEPGDTITLSVLRGTATMDIEVTLGQPETMSDFMPFFGQHGFGPDGFFQFQQPETPQVPQPNA